MLRDLRLSNSVGGDMWLNLGQRTSCGIAVAMMAAMAMVNCKSDQPAMPPPDGSSAPDAGGAPDAPQAGPQALPMTVSDYFAPSGFMGDGGESPTALVVQLMNCKQPRPSTAAGDCYHVTYTPATLNWAGVYWQYPENNWGAMPGKQVEAGATKVTFYAAGKTGGEKLQFLAGGEDDANLPHHDGFKATTMITLTTTLTQYQIDLSGGTYDTGVLGAFAWTFAEPQGSRAPLEFYLDTIRWEK